MSNYAPLNSSNVKMNSPSSGSASFRDIMIPVMYFLTVMALPALSNLVGGSQSKSLITFLALPMMVLLMARDPRFKINRNLAMGATIAAYVLVAGIAGTSNTFKQAIEDPKNAPKAQAGLIWLGVMLMYAMFIIVPVVSGISPLYENSNK